MNQKHGRFLDELMMDVPFEDFLAKFNFDHKRGGDVRVRREYLLIDVNGNAVPEAKKIIEKISEEHHDSTEFYPGITDCHLSVRTKPVRRPRDLFDEMSKQDISLNRAARHKDTKFLMCDILDRHFLPSLEKHCKTSRYQLLAEQLDRELLERAVLTHTICIEVFMSDMETAIRSSNRMRPYLEEKRAMGEIQMDAHWENLVSISGKRPVPDMYKDVRDFHASASRHGFAANPARSSHLMNISAEDGTLRLDFYKTTSKHSRIVEWAEEAQRMIKNPAPLPEIEVVNVGDAAG